MKKEILLNGVAVGEYESTGEIRKDIKIVQKYLKENGLWKDVSIVDSMFGQAQSFAQTANELYVNKICKKPRQPSAFSPFVVNAAFSIEVYLKAIHMLYGQRKSGHSIKGLYESLNKEAKNVIADLIKKIEPEYKLEPTTKFESILNDLMKETRERSPFCQRSSL